MTTTTEAAMMLLPKKMEANHKQAGEGKALALISQDQAALDIIRRETVLSKLPIHNLAKKGRVDIQINKVGPDGNAELKWEISYNEKYGQARQLAYKLDTIVIDSVIDEVGRPLPERLRLGSLRDLAEQLSLGHNIAKLKKAFHQNAGTYITAKVKYKANDGTEHLLEAGFTRYSVLFTGQKFTDGTRADAVYITFNPDYREVLNNAPVRPLNRAYMKELPPAAQRFYEIVSFKIFSAIKYNHPQAKLLYSEYCTSSAQQRYFDYDHFKKQMYKVHRPHLKSGYIEKVHYQETTDSEKKRDWIMCYVPGPKAHAEFAAAHRGYKMPHTIDLDASDIGESKPRRSGPRQRRLNLQPVQEPPAKAPEQPAPAPEIFSINQEFLAALTTRGITETAARKLLAALKPDQQVLDQLEWGEHQVRTNPDKYTNPAGFFIHLIQENVTVPENFETSRKQAARLAEEARRREEEQLRAQYEQHKKHIVDDYIAKHPAEFAALKEEHAKKLADRYGFEPEMMNRLARTDAWFEIGKKVSLLSFEEFVYAAKAEQALVAAHATPVEPSTELIEDSEHASTEIPTPDAGQAQTFGPSLDFIRRQAYEGYIEQTIDAYAADPAHQSEIEALASECRDTVTKEWPAMARQNQENVIKRMVRDQLKKNVARISFEDFVASLSSSQNAATDPLPSPDHQAQPSEPSAPAEN